MLAGMKPMTVAEMAAMGGKARARSLTAAKRKAIASAAAAKRWGKAKPAP